MPVVTEELKSTEDHADLLDIGPPALPPWRHGYGGDGSAGEPDFAFPISKGQLGLWLALTAIAMLFAGLSSAYIVMRGAPSWQNVALPNVLWVNTVFLLGGSFTIEAARRTLGNGHLRPARSWMVATAVLGLLFVVGQLVAWQQLVAVGVYLPTTLHSSFLYVLTGAHAVHVVGGLVALGFVMLQTLRNRYSASSHEPVTLCATYWHFMDGLWIYLFLLLVLA